MEAHYLAANRRVLKLQKHVCLAEVAPERLLKLKFSGRCTFTLPEWLCDMDYPGHYRRRLRAGSVTVPAVVGPYANVNATLTLIRNAVRVSTDVAVGYGDALKRGRRRPVPVAPRGAVGHCRQPRAQRCRDVRLRLRRRAVPAVRGRGRG